MLQCYQWGVVVGAKARVRGVGVAGVVLCSCVGTCLGLSIAVSSLMLQRRCVSLALAVRRCDRSAMRVSVLTMSWL